MSSIGDKWGSVSLDGTEENWQPQRKYTCTKQR